MMKSSFLAFVALAVSGYAEAATYSRTASLSGQSFLDAFSWKELHDPTNGRVNYVSQSTAGSAGLYSVSGNTVTLRADHTTVLNPSGPGRDSFRLQSNNQYRTHVAIFDIGHMPVGCGTWPAEVGANWPYEGEIDIVEGVNNKVPNQSTLHTSANCVMPSSRLMTGTSVELDCDVYSTGNLGCGVKTADSNSFGHNFNNNGGGWYAVERTSNHISIYFWERGSSSVPSEVKYPGGSVDTSAWVINSYKWFETTHQYSNQGTPAAYFPNTLCNFASHFGPLNIIINLDFCGDWAGATYSSDGCPSTCVEYVNNVPEAFSKAYFEFNALNIYE
ncbi:glycoside hydrolase family 16 protein [Imleria badia]|nr:glycoside hydrolase family 16 protein [Imleria badia]